MVFDIDANGILHVSAKDQGTGKSQNIRIEASSGLSDEDIKRMKNEAEANAESDRKLKEETEKLNLADTAIFSSEKQLKDYGDKIPADKKAAIESALAELKTAHSARNVDALDAASANLNNAWQAASQDINNAQQAEQANNANAQNNGADNGSANQENKEGDVKDVDYEEVK